MDIPIDKFIKIFISSTVQDLAEDCRFSVMRAIKGKAVPVEMESWDSDFVAAVQVCEERIKSGSSHYIGLFAYRRGWVPDPSQGKSITEFEFDWAFQYQKIQAVFVPTHNSSFAAILRKRADDQSEADSAAQKAFLKRVTAMGVCMMFDDLAHLEGRVASRVTSWSGGGLRNIAAQSNISQEDDRKLKSIEEKLMNIGRKQQFRDFEDCLEKISAAAPEAGCFLIHGKVGFKMRDMSAALLKKLEEMVGEFSSCEIHVTPEWRERDVPSLIASVGQRLSLNLEANTIDGLAAPLKKLLETTDIVVEFVGMERLEGSLPEFVKNFWKPLIEALPGALGHKLIGLVSFELRPEQSVEPAWNDFLGRPDEDDYDSKNLIFLDELTEFKKDHISSALRAAVSFDKAKADQWAEDLLAATGGHPIILLNKIREDLINRGRP